MIPALEEYASGKKRGGRPPQWSPTTKLAVHDRRVQVPPVVGGVPDLNGKDLAPDQSECLSGWAMRRRPVSGKPSPPYRVAALTNGVRAATWTCQAFRELFDSEIPDWRHDNFYLRYAVGVPLVDIRVAHAKSKHALLLAVEHATGSAFDESVMTVGVACRTTDCNPADLFLSDVGLLKQITGSVGPLQLIYVANGEVCKKGGEGKIRRILEEYGTISGPVKLGYIAKRDSAWAVLLSSGVDLWLDRPEKAVQPSVATGMKAALNGVPSISVLDGWGKETHVEGVTGWSIGVASSYPKDREDVNSRLYDKLQRDVMPLFYEQPRDYTQVMRFAIALNGSLFNSQRIGSDPPSTVED